MRSRLTLVLVMFALLLLPLTVAAHHGWAGNGDEEFEITGTLAGPVSMVGPHATMKIKASDGQVWDFTLASAPQTKSAGLTETAIPVGATVTAHGHRNRDPKKFEVKTERVTFNGKTFNVYPNRSSPRWPVRLRSPLASFGRTGPTPASTLPARFSRCCGAPATADICLQPLDIGLDVNPEEGDDS